MPEALGEVEEGAEPLEVKKTAYSPPRPEAGANGKQTDLVLESFALGASNLYKRFIQSKD